MFDDTFEGFITLERWVIWVIYQTAGYQILWDKETRFQEKIKL